MRWAPAAGCPPGAVRAAPGEQGSTGDHGPARLPHPSSQEVGPLVPCQVLVVRFPTGTRVQEAPAAGPARGGPLTQVCLAAEPSLTWAFLPHAVTAVVPSLLLMNHAFNKNSKFFLLMLQLSHVLPHLGCNFLLDPSPGPYV